MCLFIKMICRCVSLSKRLKYTAAVGTVYLHYQDDNITFLEFPNTASSQCPVDALTFWIEGNGVISPLLQHRKMAAQLDHCESEMD